MKPLWRVFCMAALCPGLCLAVLPAAAQDRHRPWADLFAAQHNSHERTSQRPARDGYNPDQSGAESPEQRREQMSPEDRRQLRRDVRDAGRDIYSERMPPEQRNSRHH